ncbi:ECF transporter S component [Kaistia dalseonensis]|uniref:Energy-coupling factor transport system substrate-specific component n=1 Tax=Kaistia dalseonensis TaxID=410840 RepID=A0ABU0HAG8_9HYPH|nr:ECF transporter S component [Kaistia dalseonensis]MCX5496683.1 ECF transporter S component [Kaistia dalseonensis]MDQ0439308.1 energy-coupling factor transport system substrate-specific component [Kaistia dalseonensis]
MKFDTRTLILIAAAIVINIVGGQIAHFVKLPLYLDSVGTILVGILAGPWAGGIAGLLTNLVWGLILNPVAAAFAPVALVIGIAAGFLARAGWFKSWWQSIISGAIIAVPSTIIAVPIIVYMFGGVTGGGPDFAAAYLLAVGTSLIQSVAFSNLGINILDKALAALIAWVVASRLPTRLTSSFGFFSYSKA